MTSENPHSVGWIPYTGNFTDVGALTKLLVLGLEDLGADFEIGFKLKNMQEIPSGNNTKNKHQEHGGTWMTYPWQMIHIETDLDNTREVVSLMS